MIKQPMCAKKVQGLLDNDITNISKPSHKVFSLHILISSSIAPPTHRAIEGNKNDF